MLVPSIETTEEVMKEMRNGCTLEGSADPFSIGRPYKLVRNGEGIADVPLQIVQHLIKEGQIEPIPIEGDQFAYRLVKP